MAAVTDWPFPSAWLVRPLSVAGARATVEGDLGVSLADTTELFVRGVLAPEWEAVAEAAEAGAALWLYDAPPAALGGRGIAAIRACAVVAEIGTLAS